MKGEVQSYAIMKKHIVTGLEKPGWHRNSFILLIVFKPPEAF